MERDSKCRERGTCWETGPRARTLPRSWGPRSSFCFAARLRDCVLGPPEHGSHQSAYSFLIPRLLALGLTFLGSLGNFAFETIAPPAFDSGGSALELWTPSEPSPASDQRPPD